MKSALHLPDSKLAHQTASMATRKNPSAIASTLFRPRGFLVGWFPDEHVIHDRVPGVMYAGEEQQQRCSPDTKQGLVNVGTGSAGRCSQHQVCDEGEQNMK